MNDPAPLPATPTPAAAPVTSQPTTHPRRTSRRLLPIILLVLALSLLGNVILSVVLLSGVLSPFDSESSASLEERFYLGDKDARDKVAVVRVDGLISESRIVYPVKQLEKAAKDKRVKAVVLRVDSPGGTVYASEELYQCVVNVRDNTGRRFPASGPKPVAVSMGGVAASGGYYVSTAGSPISAERTTITGSVGVFAMLPNVAQLAHDHGVKVELVKAGGLKASGSFLHDMTQEERQTWQDTVDNAYDLFLERIAAGRSGLTPEKLRSELVVDRQVPRRDEKGNTVTEKGNPVLVRYTRVRADGGTFTAEEARQFGLVDKVEDLPAAIRAAATAAGLGSFKAVVYDRPPGLLDLVLGSPASAQPAGADLRGLSSALTPRLWYLTPSAEGGILTAGQ
jgi:protease-4